MRPTNQRMKVVHRISLKEGMFIVQYGTGTDQDPLVLVGKPVTSPEDIGEYLPDQVGEVMIDPDFDYEAWKREQAEEEARQARAEEERKRAGEAVEKAEEEEQQRRLEEERQREALRRQAIERARKQAREEHEAEERKRREAEEAARRHAEEEERKQAEARRTAEQEAARQKQAELEAARRKKREAARLRKEQEERKRREEERRREEEERQRAEQEAARQRALDLARKQAALKARREEEEARRRAEEQRVRRENEERVRRENEERKRREEEKRRQALERARKEAALAAQRQAEQEALRRAEEDARNKAEEERQRLEEQERQRLEEQERRRQEEQAAQVRLAEEQERRRRAEQERLRLEEQERRRQEEQAAQARQAEEQERLQRETERRNAENERRRQQVEALRNQLPTARKLYQAGLAFMAKTFLAARQRRDFDPHAADALLHGVLETASINPSALTAVLQRDGAGDYAVSHSVNVGILCLAFGSYLGLPREQLLQLGRAALLHDVGRARIPMAVLDKPGALTDKERRMVRSRPTMGADMLHALGLEPQVVRTVREHHERHDGSGYPAGLAGRAISPHARILAVADVFDAMTTPTPYRRPQPPPKILGRMYQWSGTLFDPEVAERFIKFMGIYPVGSLVRLSGGGMDGLCGVVMAVQPRAPLRPTVRVCLDAAMQPAKPRLLHLSAKGNETVSVSEFLDPAALGLDAMALMR